MASSKATLILPKTADRVSERWNGSTEAFSQEDRGFGATFIRVLKPVTRRYKQRNIIRINGRR
jgi:hypothetical protein